MNTLHTILLIIFAKGVAPLSIAGMVCLYVWLLSSPNGGTQDGEASRNVPDESTKR